VGSPVQNGCNVKDVNRVFVSIDSAKGAGFLPYIYSSVDILGNYTTITFPKGNHKGIINKVKNDAV